MRCIIRKETDPFFNLAAEEFIFKNFEEDTFMLWRNEPSVIIGKHQNAFAELNHKFIKENNIKVVRRISGGGAVYHDLGNLNFTFLAKADPEHLVDFNRYTEPILQTLERLGIKVTIGKRNSLYLSVNESKGHNIEQLKISGNAEHVYKNKVMHHGTLLFNSNLENLENALAPTSRIHYEDKAVKSVRSKVTNILDHLVVENNVHGNQFNTSILNIEDFADYIYTEALNTLPTATIYEISVDDYHKIEQLKSEKYVTWEWNYGYSPSFNLTTNFKLNNIEFSADIYIKNGCIESINIYDTSSRSVKISQVLRSELISLPLNEIILKDKLKPHLSSTEISQIIRSLFGYDDSEQLNKAGV